MLCKQPRHQFSWTSLALLLLSCPNPRNFSIIIPWIVASAIKSNTRPLWHRLVVMNDDPKRSRRHHPWHRQRQRPEDKQALQKEIMLLNL